MRCDSFAGMGGMKGRLLGQVAWGSMAQNHGQASPFYSGGNPSCYPCYPCYLILKFFIKGGGYTGFLHQNLEVYGMSDSQNLTEYEPFDGDYGDYDYTKLIFDIQRDWGYQLGAYLEICVTFDDDEISIECANGEGNEWIDHYYCKIPAGWTVEQLTEMFEGSVYMKTYEYEAENETI